MKKTISLLLVILMIIQAVGCIEKTSEKTDEILIDKAEVIFP